MNAFRETRRRSRCSADLAAFGLYLLALAVAILAGDSYSRRLGWITATSALGVNLWQQTHSTDEPHDEAVDSAQHAAIGTS